MNSAETRCSWAGTDPRMIAYHDDEWGYPVRDGRALWEKLMLDGFQAGLSWATILYRRDGFVRAFEGFDPAVIARWGEKDVERLLGDEGIIRSRAKIESTIGGARAYLKMLEAGLDFSDYCWGFVDGTPIRDWQGTWIAKTPLSEAISKDLKSRGFKFVGPVIVYAWMQAVGLVDDHSPDCFRCRD